MSYRPFLLKHRSGHSETKSKSSGQAASTTEQLTDPRDLIQAVLEAEDSLNQERVDTLICNALKTLKVTRFKPDQGLCLALLYLAKMKPHCFAKKPIVESLMAVLKRDLCPAFKVKNNTILPLVAAHILMAAHSDAKQWPNGLSLAIFEEYNKYPIKGLEYVPQNLCMALRLSLFQEFDIQMLISYIEFLVNNDKDLAGLSDDFARFIVSRQMTINHIIHGHGQKHKTYFYKTFADVFNRHIEYSLLNCLNSDLDAEDDTIMISIDDVQDERETPRAFVQVYNGHPRKNPDGKKMVNLKQNTIWGMLYLLTLGHNDESRVEYNLLHDCWFYHDKMSPIYTSPSTREHVQLPVWIKQEFLRMDPNQRTEFINAAIDTTSNDKTHSCKELIMSLTTFGTDQEVVDMVLGKLDDLCDSIDSSVVKLSIENKEFTRDIVESVWESGGKNGHKFVKLCY